MFDVLEAVASATKINDGIWIHLYSTDADGEKVPLYLDPNTQEKPCRALVRSIRSDHYRAEERKLNASGAVARGRQRAGQASEMVEKQIAKREPALFAAALISLENCSTTGAPVQAVSKEQAFELANKPNMQWMVEQIVVAAGDDALFGPEAIALGEPNKTPKEATKK